MTCDYESSHWVIQNIQFLHNHQTTTHFYIFISSKRNFIDVNSGMCIHLNEILNIQWNWYNNTTLTTR